MMGHITRDDWHSEACIEEAHPDLAFFKISVITKPNESPLLYGSDPNSYRAVCRADPKRPT